MRKMNDSAQWQLIEVVLVAGMLFAAMYLVRSASITVYKSIEEENPLKAQGYDALESLASQPPPDGFSDEYHSLLEYYIIENPPDELENSIKELFPSDVNFKVILIDMTELKDDQTKTMEYYLDPTNNPPLVNSDYWIEEGACVSNRIVQHDGNVYKVVLMLWYNV